VSESQTCEAICLGVVRILREERQRQGISMEVLADKAGLSKGMVSLVERDLRNPTLNTIVRLARALDMDLARVLRNVTQEVTLKKPRKLT
jgi:transcriptional regulator with XRE-family HTH domain